jgi:hypothetical protein
VIHAIPALGWHFISMLAILIVFYSILKKFLQELVSPIALFAISWFWGYAILNTLVLVPGFNKIFFTIPTNMLRFLSIVTIVTAIFRLSMSRKYYLSLIFSLLLLYPLSFLLTTSTDDNLGLHSSIGSLHTGKYVYFAEYLKLCTELPKVRHNLAQSNFAAVISHISGSNTALSLMGVLVFSKVAIASFIYYLSHSIVGLKRSLSFIVMLVTTAGSFSLSMAHLLVHDSGNPLILNGYSDVIFGIFVMLFVCMLFASEEFKFLWKSLILLVPLNVTLLIGSPQVFLLIAGLSILFILLKQWRNIAAINMLSIVIALLIWRNSTGILATGVANVFEFLPKTTYKWFSGELISPGIPYMIGSPGMQSSEINPKVIDVFKFLLSETDVQRMVWHFEIAIWLILKVLFWPLLGLLLGFLLNVSTKFGEKVGLEDKSYQVLRKNGLIAVFSFVLLFPITFFLKLGEMKWETTRFAFPAYVLLMFIMSATLLKINQQNRLMPIAIGLLGLLPTLIFVGLAMKYSIQAGLITSSSSDFGVFSLFGKTIDNIWCQG